MTLDFLKRPGPGQVMDGRLRGQQFKNAGGRPHAILNRHMNTAQILDRIIEEEDATDESQESSRAEVGEIDIEKRKRNSDGGNSLHHRLHDGGALFHAHAGAKLLIA